MPQPRLTPRQKKSSPTLSPPVLQGTILPTLNRKLTIRDVASGLATIEEAQAFLASLTPAEKFAKLYEWEFWARKEQLLPTHRKWLYWAVIAGRGFGKTRTGGEAVRKWNREGFRYINLIGATFDDAEKIMIQGESGILSICPPAERPRWISNRKELRWPNGAVSLVFSAEEPDRLRGKQSDKLWCDELAAWRYADAWDQALLGLRLGREPQAVITTTPRATQIIKDLLSDPETHITTGSTYANKANLSKAFIHKVIRKYEGTRMGRQELLAELLEDVPGALWNRALLDQLRVKPKDVPPLRRIVVAIDPPATSGEDADEAGIICAGKDDNGHAYVLEDASGQAAPIEWARKAVALYKARKGDRIVAEVNQGGEMVIQTIRTVDENVPVRSVHATRGKYLRAEPISGHYEQKRVHHVGTFAKLEDQMCAFTPDFDRKAAGYSPDRLDALVWALTDLMVEPDYGGIIDYYRTQAEALAAKQAAAPKDGR